MSFYFIENIKRKPLNSKEGITLDPPKFVPFLTNSIWKKKKKKSLKKKKIPKPKKDRIKIP